ncbi:hypothetical protein EV128_102332 [Rhizobium azibense]|nr:hypothetical protein EV128_102332 [Rhizobium azibense]
MVLPVSWTGTPAVPSGDRKLQAAIDDAMDRDVCIWTGFKAMLLPVTMMVRVTSIRRRVSIDKTAADISIFKHRAREIVP